MGRDCQSQEFRPRDLSLKAQNPGTVPTIFVPVQNVDLTYVLLEGSYELRFLINYC